MADRTSASGEMTREELSTYLGTLSERFGDGDSVVVPVGNKTVTLHPPSRLNYEVTVEERSPILGSDREELEITFSWKPPRGTERGEEDEAGESRREGHALEQEP